MDHHVWNNMEKITTELIKNQKKICIIFFSKFRSVSVFIKEFMKKNIFESFARNIMTSHFIFTPFNHDENSFQDFFLHIQNNSDVQAELSLEKFP